MVTISEAFAIAVEHHQAGRLEMAEEICRRIVAVDSEQADAWHLLGAICHQLGRHPEAEEGLVRAIGLRPTVADYHNNLGVVLAARGKPAEAAFRQAVQLAPDNTGYLANLALALKSLGRLDEAVGCHRRLVELSPNDAEAHFTLAVALKARGKAEEAIGEYGRALELDPQRIEIWNEMAVALKDLNRLDEAITCFRRVLEVRPDFAEIHSNLGTALAAQGKPDEAIASYQRAVELKPEYAEGHSNLGTMLKAQGRIAEAAEAFGLAAQLRPEAPQVESNLVYTLLFHPDYDAAAIFAATRDWERRHATPLGRLARPHENDPSPNRRLRLGYVSPDFCDHVVGRNLAALLREHDHCELEIFCYSDVARPDSTTVTLRSCADAWRETCGLTDDRVAEWIRKDRIDILVDTTMHMAFSRLGVFARKPAPVQACGFAYPGTTGMAAIAYRITDRHLDPPGLNDRFYAEEPIRLESFWCYDPLTTQPDPGPPPALDKGHVTFGCLGNYCKVNAGVLELWADVLKAVPGSRLLLMAPEGSHRRRAAELLARRGVSGERLSFALRQPFDQYLELYRQIDVGLDSFPYNGHSTSLDSFWMGVPVVTLVGRTVVGRAGLSQLTNLGLPQLIAETPEQYVRIAADLAGGLPRLADLRRATLRGRMQRSPLADAPGFARGIEAGYRLAWRRWCAES